MAEFRKRAFTADLVLFFFWSEDDFGGVGGGVGCDSEELGIIEFKSHPHYANLGDGIFLFFKQGRKQKPGGSYVLVVGGL